MENTSLQRIAAVQVAAIVCTHPYVKKWISGCQLEDSYRCCDGCVEKLRRNSEKYIVRKIIECFQLPKELENLVCNVFDSLAVRVIIWADYHKDVFDIPRKALLEHIGISTITPQGLVEYRKAAINIVEDITIDISTRYKISCVYFLEATSGEEKGQPKLLSKELWKEVPKKERTKILKECSAKGAPSELIKNVSLMYCQNRKPNYQKIWLSSFRNNLDNGNMFSLKYCWEKINQTNKGDLLQHGLLATVSNIQTVESSFDMENDISSCTNTTAPKEHYTDILCYLISQLDEEQKIKFLLEDIKENGYSTVLECFLEWPYQHLFLKTIACIWDTVPKENFKDLLLDIAQNIDSLKAGDGNVLQRCDRSFDYRLLLREVWCQSPKQLKRCLFEDLSALEVLLNCLYSCKEFSNEDEQFIKIVLSEASPEECIDIACKYGDYICLNLLESNRFRLVLSFWKLCGLTEIEIIQQKRNILSSDYAIPVFSRLISIKKYELAENIIKWCLPSTEEIQALMIHLPRRETLALCKDLILYDWENFETFVDWCLPNLTDLINFKTDFPANERNMIFYKAISKGLWEQTELFMTWCFSTEEQMKKCKGCDLLPTFGTDILCKLTRKLKWADAELFVSWLEISEVEVNELKQDTIFDNEGFLDILFDIVFADSDSDGDCFWIEYYGNKLVAFEHILKWYLKNKQGTLLFQSLFAEEFQQELSSDDFRDFMAIIMQHLADLECV